MLRGEDDVLIVVSFSSSSADQVRYDFYIPPVLYDGPRAPQMRSFPIPRQPITPFPRVVKVLSPDRATELPRQHGRTKAATSGAPMGVDESKMLTLYGENFVKGQTLGVWFGAEPAPYVEVRCSEVVGCLPPAAAGLSPPQRRPVFLVRGDGIIFPSAATYS
jgi:recombining binding protein suppressor of hairless